MFNVSIDQLLELCPILIIYSQLNIVQQVTDKLSKIPLANDY